jgi:3',5'-cyclic AMP phosphodiesterase CpdA
MDSAPQASTGRSEATRRDGFCFAHLSDPHLTSLEHVRQRDLYSKRVLGYLSWRSRRREEHRQHVLEALLRDLGARGADHTVITGDLTHLGLPSECLEARVWLGRLGAPNDVTVVPGNHDMYAPDRWQETLAHWVPFMKADGVDAAASDRYSVFPSLRVRGPVAFIGASSACPSAPFFATGRLGRRQLSALDELLERTGETALIRVLLIHHPPVGQVVGWRKRLRDAEPLRRILERRGVELILHGHAHRSTLETLVLDSAAVPVIGVPSASGIGLRPGRRAQYHLYRFEDRGGERSLSVEVRGYQHAEQAFVREGERTVPLGVAAGRMLNDSDAA